jgi:transposase
MSKNTRYLGLDVHAETITAAIAEGRQKIRSLGQFPNRPEAVRKFIEKLGGPKELKVCYEAGPTGYALYWQLTDENGCRMRSGGMIAQGCSNLATR